jgi:hypothetical protein
VALAVAEGKTEALVVRLEHRAKVTLEEMDFQVAAWVLAEVVVVLVL